MVLGSKYKKKLLKNCKIVSDNFSIKKVNLLLEGEKVVEIFERGLPEIKDAEVVDLEESLVFKGLTDIHVHGGGGFSFAEKTKEPVVKALEAQMRSGTCFLIATFVSLPPKRLELSLRILRDLKRDFPGLLGAYIEGPFINPEKRGGMRKDFLNWSLKEFSNLIENFADVIKAVVVAPEHPLADSAADVLERNGVMIAIGHSAASFERTVEFSRRASLFTHIYNAMGTFHHRNPGVLGCALLSDLYCEIIPEKHHMHKAALELAFRLKGKEKMIPVSDGTPLSASQKNEAVFSGVKVVKVNGAVFSEEEKLFGSAISLVEGLKNLVKWKIYRDLEEAVFYNIKNTYSLLGHDVFVKRGSTSRLWTVRGNTLSPL